MKIKCEKARENILSSGPLPPETAAHLSACAECRALQSLWARLKDVRPDVNKFSPPPSVDSAVLKAAGEYLSRKKTMHFRHLRWIAAYVAAACLVLATVVTYRQFSPPGTESGAGGTTAAVKTAPTWDKIDMSSDLFEVSAEIELGKLSICSSPNNDVEDGGFSVDIEVPELAI